MTYNAIEISTQDGAPVELYKFTRGNVAYTYTSGQETITRSEDRLTYEPKPISRTNIEATAESARTAITITVPRDLPIVDLYRIAPPSDVVTVTIFRFHTTDAADELVTVWAGRILNVKWRGALAEIHAEPVYTSLKRPGLRRLYQRSCPHALYSAACGVPRTAYKIEATVDAVAGSQLTINAAAGYADGYFDGGYLEHQTGIATFERRMIVAHAGSAITIAASIPSLAAGAEVRLFPGCPKTFSICEARFNNAANFGGFPWIPHKNPFGGDPIF